MPRKRDDAGEYSRVIVRIEGYEASVETGINIDLLASTPHWSVEKDPVQTHDQRIELFGTCIDPPDRLGARVEVSLRQSTGGMKFETLKDIHEHDKNHLPVYRNYRDGAYPVYRVPPGIATLEKRRGAALWTAWLRMDANTMQGALTLLGAGRRLFLMIQRTEARPYAVDYRFQPANPRS